MDEIEGSRVDFGLLTKDNYLYIRNRSVNGKLYLKCREKTCGCTAQWEPARDRFFINIPHNHDANAIDVEVLKLKAELKNLIRRGERPYRKVFEEVCAKYSQDATDRVALYRNTLRKHRFQVNRRKKQLMPDFQAKVHGVNQSPSSLKLMDVLHKGEVQSEHQETFTQVADTDDDDTFNEEEARNYETIEETTVTDNIETPPNENESVITEILKEAEVPIVDQSQPIRDQEDRLNIMKRSFNLQRVSKQVAEDNEKLFCEPIVKLKKLKMSLSKEKPREASCHVTGSECVMTVTDNSEIPSREDEPTNSNTLKEVEAVDQSQPTRDREQNLSKKCNFNLQITSKQQTEDNERPMTTVTNNSERPPNEDEPMNTETLKKAEIADQSQLSRNQEDRLNIKRSYNLQVASKQQVEGNERNLPNPRVKAKKLKKCLPTDKREASNEVTRLEFVVSKLERLSDKMAAVTFGDSYDQFGKYIATLLRGLPRKAVNSLKRKMVQDVLDVKFDLDDNENSLPNNKSQNMSSPQQHLKKSDISTSHFVPILPVSTLTNVPSDCSLSLDFGTTPKNVTISQQPLKVADSSSQANTSHTDISGKTTVSTVHTNLSFPQHSLRVPGSNSLSKESIVRPVIMPKGDTTITNCSFPQTLKMPNRSTCASSNSCSISANDITLPNCSIPQQTQKAAVDNSHQSGVSSSLIRIPPSLTTASGSDTEPLSFPVSQSIPNSNTLTCPTLLLGSLPVAASESQQTQRIAVDSSHQSGISSSLIRIPPSLTTASGSDTEPLSFPVSQSTCSSSALRCPTLLLGSLPVAASGSTQLFTLNQQMVLNHYTVPVQPNIFLVNSLSTGAPVIASSAVSEKPSNNRTENPEKCSKPTKTSGSVIDPLEDFPMDIEDGTELADMKRDDSFETIFCGDPLPEMKQELADDENSPL
uniref:FLYWCH-type domain-containing protein n=1 Tax=Homalodisca liturata TaxID=320908 RepID=A0A1B6HBD6_9HEMI